MASEDKDIALDRVLVSFESSGCHKSRLDVQIAMNEHGLSIRTAIRIASLGYDRSFSSPVVILCDDSVGPLIFSSAVLNLLQIPYVC